MKVKVALFFGLVCSLSMAGDAVRSIRAGAQHNCALFESGIIRCWGFNGPSGLLGIGSAVDAIGDSSNEMGGNLKSVLLGEGKKPVDLSVGLHSCALLEDGTVKCWGLNGHGQLGLGDKRARGYSAETMGTNLPVVNLGANVKVKQISVSYYHSCALTTDNRVKCWGRNDLAQLGLGHTDPVGASPNSMGDNLPYVDLGKNEKAKDVCARGLHSCAVLESGALKCWGSNENNILGPYRSTIIGDIPEETGDKLQAIPLGNVKAKGLSCGELFTCAHLEGGGVKCIGGNQLGQLGIGDNVARGSDAQQLGDKLPSIDFGVGQVPHSIVSGLDHSCALFGSQTIKCWGGSYQGQLGLGVYESKGDTAGEMGDDLPFVDLGDLAAVKDITLGRYHSCALLGSGKVKCWGANDFGKLGLGDTQTRGRSLDEMGENLPVLMLD